jgi:hypothetical protein
VPEFGLCPTISALRDSILPDVQTAIFDKLGTITEKLATLEERTQTSKAIVVGTFLMLAGMLIGGLTWSGVQQYQLGSLSKSVEMLAATATKTNDRLDKIVASIEQQSKHADLAPPNRREVGYTASVAKYIPPYNTNVMQTVTLTAKLKVAGQKSLYRVPALVPVNRYMIQQVWVSVEKPIPGTAISARLDDSEKNWEIEVVAEDPTAFAKTLDAGIVITVNVIASGYVGTTGNAFVDPIPYAPQPSSGPPAPDGT